MGSNGKNAMRYCRRLLEVDAIPFTGDNFHQIDDFVGGGCFLIEDSGEKLIIFTAQGKKLCMAENWWVIKDDSGRIIDVYDPQQFRALFEPKFPNVGDTSFE